jgi:hypothetical protein
VKSVKLISNPTIRISEHSDVVEKEDGELRVVLVTTIDDGLKKEGLLREVVRAVNNMRKEQGLTREDRVVLSYKTDDALLASVFTDFADELKASVLADDVLEWLIRRLTLRIQYRSMGEGYRFHYKRQNKKEPLDSSKKW